MTSLAKYLSTNFGIGSKKQNTLPFLHFRREFDDLFNDFCNCAGYNPAISDGEYALLTPKINVAEGNKAYEISAELPGVKKEDIKASVSDGILTISAEKKEEKDEKEKNWHRVESYYGTFERQIHLSDNIKDESIVADFQDGLLRITVEKRVPTEVKQHNVKQISIK